MDFDTIIKEATAQKALLLEQVALLEALVKSAEALTRVSSSMHANVEGHTRTVMAPKPATQLNTKVLSAPRIGNIMRPTLEATANALRQAGKPLKTSALLQLVVTAGVRVGGKNEVATLSARLSNSLEFHNHRDVGWWLKDEPLPGQVSIFAEAGGGQWELDAPRFKLKKRR